MNGARRHDWLERPLETLASRWRRRVWCRALEVGAGIGSPCCSPGTSVVRTDCRKVLDHAAERAGKTGPGIDIRSMEPCRMTPPNEFLDTTGYAIVFCQAKHEIPASSPIRRAFCSGARGMLLEHIWGHGPLGKALALPGPIACAWSQRSSRDIWVLPNAGLVVERRVSLLSSVVVTRETWISGGKHDA